MSSLSACSPIAIHFGGLETRLLQLQRTRKGWAVRAAKSFSARGKNRHWQVSEAFKQDLRAMHVRGKIVLETTEFTHETTQSTSNESR